MELQTGHARGHRPYDAYAEADSRSDPALLKLPEREGGDAQLFGSTEEVIAELHPSEPVFCLKASRIREAARLFATFPGRVLYAVKCNPHPVVLDTLYEEGVADFDVASLSEIELVDRHFNKTAGLFFNNPAKSRRAVREASHGHGVRFFTADCLEEIDKIADEGCLDDSIVVACRLATPPKGARYTLTTKFGATADDAVRILRRIDDLGIRAGISFHVGSQCSTPRSFSAALKLSGKVIREAKVPMSVLNVGGGFPVQYPGERLPDIAVYLDHVVRGFRSLNLGRGCMLHCEPGRSLVASAGTVLVQVVMRRGKNIFLNDGVFGTLQELVSPLERRPVRIVGRSGPASPNSTDFRVFGPTCDSNDVLGAPWRLPDDVREGDWIEVGMMGAYSLSMRTKFNGFYTERVVSLA